MAVFKIPELAEMILMEHRCLNDLLAASSANYHLRQTIRGSERILRKMTWLTGDREYHLRAHRVPPYAIPPCNSIFRRLIHFRKRGSNFEMLQVYYPSGPKSSNGPLIRITIGEMRVLSHGCINRRLNMYLHITAPHNHGSLRDIRLSLPGVDLEVKRLLHRWEGMQTERVFPGGSTMGDLCDWLYGRQIASGSQRAWELGRNWARW